MGQPVPLRLDVPATPIAARRGEEVVLRGSFKSTLDGSVVDAATTSWPAGAPGGASLDQGGLVDLAAGGFRVTARDPVTHEVHAMATGEAAPACAAAGVSAPCLPLRTVSLSQSRLVTVGEWQKSLVGEMTVEAPQPAAVTAPLAEPAPPWAWITLGVVVMMTALGSVIAVQRSRAGSAEGRLLALAKRVRAKVTTADRVLAAPLSPALESALAAVKGRRVRADSAEGRRIAEVLVRVETAIDRGSEEARAEAEREVVDDLAREVESALEAAAEAEMISPRPRGP
jgi:hypothetical protein